MIFFFFLISSENYVNSDAGVGLIKQTIQENPDSSPGSPVPLAIDESPETADQSLHQQTSASLPKRQRLQEAEDS